MLNTVSKNNKWNLWVIWKTVYFPLYLFSFSGFSLWGLGCVVAVGRLKWTAISPAAPWTPQTWAQAGWKQRLLRARPSHFPYVLSPYLPNGSYDCLTVSLTCYRHYWELCWVTRDLWPLGAVALFWSAAFPFFSSFFSSSLVFLLDSWWETDSTASRSAAVGCTC